MRREKKYRSKISLGFYKRKLVFFVSLFIIVVVGGAFYTVSVYNNDISADSVNTYSENYGTPVTQVEIQKDGLVAVNGQKSKTQINSIPGYDELRIVLLDQPSTYMESYIAIVSLPKSVALQTKHQILAIHGVESTASEIIDSTHIKYSAFGVAPNATVSIVADMPEGTISYPLFRNLVNDLGAISFNKWTYTIVVIPLGVFIYMILFLAYQRRLYKVDVPEKAITSPPMAIPPALVGVLFHESVTPREIASTLVDLALRRDILILDRNRGFAFGKGKFDDRLLSYEKILLSKIFQNNIASSNKYIEEKIQSHLYSKKISVVSAGIYSIATRLGYFRLNPRKVHNKFRLIGIVLFLAGAVGFFASFMIKILPQGTAFFWVGMMVASFVIVVTAKNIPKRTEIGKEALSNWLAFRKFLADPNPIEYTPTVHQLFESYLPYAIALDCEAAWARRFEPHNFAVPDWFLSDKDDLSLEDFCLSLFPIISYVGRSLAALREPGFE